MGYELGDDGVDSYGVDHNGFSTRDEAAYQFTRDKREEKLLDYYQNQGMNNNYPLYGTDFWSSAADNNYGFGKYLKNCPICNKNMTSKTDVFFRKFSKYMRNIKD